MITIIDYKAGNITSVKNMLKKIGVESEISDNAEHINQADKLILPGVGSFDYGVANLQSSGLFDLIIKKAKQGTPLLGICLGAQLLGIKSEEGLLNGLGLIDMQVVKFNRNLLSDNLKIPHMGWSDVIISKTDSTIFGSFTEIPRFYFVHSYHFQPNHPELVSSTAHYGYSFAASIEKENVFGVQFHPEKSHRFGLAVLKQFAEI